MPADPIAAFSTNLSELAALGKLDPLIGRNDELERTVQILARRRKNNPIFVGMKVYAQGYMIDATATSGRVRLGEALELTLR